MESKVKLNKKAQELIVKYSVSVLYGTSDGQFFLEKNRANLHSKIKKVAVYEFYKDGSKIDSAETVVNAKTLPSPEFRAKDENDLKVNSSKTDIPTTDGNSETINVSEEEKAKEDALKILQNEDDLNLIEYKELVKMVKDLGLEIENAKKETILDALTTERENLKTEDNG